MFKDIGWDRDDLKQASFISEQEATIKSLFAHRLASFRKKQRQIDRLQKPIIAMALKAEKLKISRIPGIWQEFFNIRNIQKS
jgi:hypothetical protein